MFTAVYSLYILSSTVATTMYIVWYLHGFLSKKLDNWIYLPPSKISKTTNLLIADQGIGKVNAKLRQLRDEKIESEKRELEERLERLEQRRDEFRQVLDNTIFPAMYLRAETTKEGCQFVIDVFSLLGRNFYGLSNPEWVKLGDIFAELLLEKGVVSVRGQLRSLMIECKIPTFTVKW